MAANYHSVVFISVSEPALKSYSLDARLPFPTKTAMIGKVKNKYQNEVKGIFSGRRYFMETRLKVLSLFRDHTVKSHIKETAFKKLEPKNFET